MKQIIAKLATVFETLTLFEVFISFSLFFTGKAGRSPLCGRTPKALVPLSLNLVDFFRETIMIYVLIRILTKQAGSTVNLRVVMMNRALLAFSGVSHALLEVAFVAKLAPAEIYRGREIPAAYK